MVCPEYRAYVGDTRNPPKDIPSVEIALEERLLVQVHNTSWAISHPDQRSGGKDLMSSAPGRQLSGTALAGELSLQLCHSSVASWLVLLAVALGSVDLQGIQVDCWFVSLCLRSISWESE